MLDGAREMIAGVAMAKQAFSMTFFSSEGLLSFE